MAVILHPATSNTGAVPVNGWVQWVTLFAAIVAAVATAAGALWTSRRSRINSEREEFMRTVRWAAEQTAEPNEAAQLVGLEVLNVLRKRDGLHVEDLNMIVAVLHAVAHDEVEGYAEGQRFTQDGEGGNA